MRAAVVGGGVFGAVAAVELARAGAEVALFEQRADLLMGASSAHQGRLHRGYHYPRDPHAGELAARADEFEARFFGCVVRGLRQHYLVANDSPTSAEVYERFVRGAGLPWAPVVPPLVRPDAASVCIAVEERFVDIDPLRAALRHELFDAGVTVRCNTAADVEALAGEHDWVVDATYGRYWPEPLRYEVCETVLVQLAPQYAGQGFVVMDGEYCSLDPHGPFHMLYDVRHSVHAVNDVPEHLVGLLDRGPVGTVHTHVDAMLGTARRFLRGIGTPSYRGSLFTVRAVLPDDGTDARPTLIRQDGSIIRILAGKLVAAPWAAEQVSLQVLQAASVP